MYDKKITANDLRWKSIKEIVDLIKDLRKQLFELKRKNEIRALKQTHLIRLTRRNIARAKYVLSVKIKENGNNRK